MIVVSNTSPIFYLSTIGQLDLLRQLYNEVVISTAVKLSNHYTVPQKTLKTMCWCVTLR
ncbi:MAG: hypothetical protein RID53_32965 [Coleofasciculus sp. B1-GNL1-01]|uniref:hypothetical protein n=1 Tax=Coleofasciculus sp. B1-GNL1-01 TaxID=3068484 RepID=UPI003302BF91